MNKFIGTTFNSWLKEKKINVDDTIIATMKEIVDSGQLWITIDDDEYYIPELIEKLEQITYSE